MRETLGESLATLQKYDAPVEQATTPSLEALKAYSEGWKLHLNRDESKAIPFFKRAIEMDPNFALAYAAMGQSYSNLGEDELAAKYTKQAFDRRDRASEREKLYITTHYYDNVTHEPAQSIQTYELWAKTYPRDDLPHNNLAVIYGGMGQLERALQEAQEAVHLDPNDSNNVANLGFSYLALNRFDEARRIIEQALVHVPDNFVCRVGIYILALLRGDARTMQQQVAWASGKAGVENIFLSIEANTATAHGNLAKARDLVQRSVAADKRDNLSAHAAATQAQAALWEAQYGNVELARKEVSALLTKEAGEIAKIMAALALGEVKNVQRAEAIVRELNLRAPNDTILNSVWLPSIRAHVEISRGNPAGAVTLLQAALPYDLGGKPPLPYSLPGLRSRTSLS